MTGVLEVLLVVVVIAAGAAPSVLLAWVRLRMTAGQWPSRTERDVCVRSPRPPRIVDPPPGQQ